MKRQTIAAWVYALACWSRSSTTSEQPKSFWIGEWVSSNASGASSGMTIKNCDSDGRCEAEVFGLGDVGKFCSRKGEAYVKADVDELTVITDQGSLIFEKDGDALTTAEVLQPSCEIDRVGRYRYLLRSKQIYTDIRDLAAGQCWRTNSPTMHEVCTDPAIFDLIRLAKSISFVSVGTWWIDDPRIQNRCDQGADVRRCAINSFEQKLKDLQAEARGMAEYGQPGDASRAQELLTKMSGVYKYNVKNTDFTCGKYQSEDVLEFVPVSDSAAYVKSRLYFSNNHSCAFAGIAEYKRIGGFVLQDTGSENAQRCILTISLDDDKVAFKDPNGNCMKFCGARGNLGAARFNLGQRKKIRYMPVIEKSQEYIGALAQYREQHGK